MLDRIMQIQLRQIEVARPVRTIQEICGELGDKEAEGRSKVKRLPDFGVELFEGDILPVVRQDPMIRHGIEHGAGGTGVAFFRRHVLGPCQIVPGGMCGHDPTGLEGGGHDVEDEEPEVPGEDEEADERARELAEEAHLQIIGRVS